MKRVDLPFSTLTVMAAWNLLLPRTKMKIWVRMASTSTHSRQAT